MITTVNKKTETYLVGDVGGTKTHIRLYSRAEGYPVFEEVRIFSRLGKNHSHLR